MAVYANEDIWGWETGTGVFCDKCEPNPDDEAIPITEDSYDPADYTVTCDKCGKRIV
jgi:hypothetical protein